MESTKGKARKKARQAVSLLAAACLALALVPAAAFAADGGDADPYDLSTATISGIDEENGYDCTGAQITPAITVTDSAGVELTDQDYTVTYGENVAPGEDAGTVTITGTAADPSNPQEGEYYGTQEATFTINDTDVLTVYDVGFVNGQVVDWTALPVKGYKYDDLQTLAGEEYHTDTLAGFYSSKGNANVQATDSYVTLEDLFEDAFSDSEMVDPWNDEEEEDEALVSLAASADGFSWSSALSKDDLTAADGEYSSWYEDAVLNENAEIFVPDGEDYDREGVLAPPSIGLTYGSATMAYAENEPTTAGEYAEEAAEAAEAHQRSFIGSLCDEETGIVSAPAGNRMVTDVDTVYVGVEVDPYDLSNAKIDGVEESYDCTGAEIKPAITVTDPTGEVLVEGTDYEVTYMNNVAPSTQETSAEVIVSGIEADEDTGTEAGDYHGEQVVDFTINDTAVVTVYSAKSMNGTIYEVDENDPVHAYYYSDLEEFAAEEGHAQTLACFYGTNVQATGSYATVDEIIKDAYEQNTSFEDPWTNADEGSTDVSVSIASISTNFSWSSTQTKKALNTTYASWYGDATNVDGSIVVGDTGSKTGTPMPASIGLSYGSVSLSTYDSADDAAVDACDEAEPCLRAFIGSSIDEETGVVSAPRGNMMVSNVDTIYVCDEIDSHDLANATISGIDEEKGYDCTGAAITPAITVTDAASVDLIEGQDYEVSYSENVAPGTATLTVTGMGEYSGEQSVEFTINDTPVFTVYDAESSNGYVDNWTAQPVKEYKYSDFTALATSGSLYGFFARQSSANVQATNSYVTFDAVIADAYNTGGSGLTDPWSSAETTSTDVSVSLKSTADDFSWSAAQTKNDLNNKYGYWYGDAKVDESGNIVCTDTTGTKAPASIGLNYGSGTLAGAESADAAAAEVLKSAEPTLRSFIGSSCDESGVVSAPAGNMMVTGVDTLYVCTEVSEFDLANADIEGIEESYDCTGAAITPAITVTDAAGVDLIEGQDYTVTYSDNVAPGTATVTITGTEDGQYKDTTQTVAFTINDNDVITVNQYEAVNGKIEGEATVVATYKYGDLQTLAAENTTSLANNWNTSRVQATDCYVTFDQLISGAYQKSSTLQDPWSNPVDSTAVSATPVAASDGLTWDPAISKYDLTEGTNAYFYGDITATSSTPTAEPVEAPAAIALTYGTVTLSNDQTASGVIDEALNNQEYNLRTCVGSSIGEGGVISSPNGKKMISDVGALDVCIERAATEDEYAELTAAIEDATATLNSAEVSDDGTDVPSDKKWVTKDVASALSAAITTATQTVETEGLLARDIENAISALNTAVSTFEAAEEDGLAASSEEYATLEAEISSAQTTLGSVQVSTNGSDVDPADKWVTQEAYDALQAAIATAQAAYEVTGASSADIEAAISALSTALSTFEAAEQSGLKPSSDETKALADEITSAQSALNGVKVSTNGSDVASSDKWVTQDVYDALKAAIDAAQATYAKTDATSTEIEAARAALSEALATFQAAQKSGTKASSTTKAKAKKQNIKCKTKVKLKKGGKKLKVKVKGVKTTLCWKANKKAQKALKIVTSTKTLTLKALKKAKKGKTYKIKLWAGVGNNYAKSKVKTIKVKIK